MVVEGGEAPVGGAGFDGGEVFAEASSGEPFRSQVLLVYFGVVHCGTF